jgi:hypothetical protein
MMLFVASFKSFCDWFNKNMRIIMFRRYMLEWSSYYPAITDALVRTRLFAYSVLSTVFPSPEIHDFDGTAPIEIRCVPGTAVKIQLLTGGGKTTTIVTAISSMNSPLISKGKYTKEHFVANGYKVVIICGNQAALVDQVEKNLCDPKVKWSNFGAFGIVHVTHEDMVGRAAWEDAMQREEQWADSKRWIHIVTIAGFFTLHQRFGDKLKVIFMDEFSEIFKVCRGPKSKRETQRFEVLEAVLANSVVACFDGAFMWHVWAFMHQTCRHFYILLGTAYNPYKHHTKIISYSRNHEAFGEACDLQEREGTPFFVMANTKHCARLIAAKIACN